MSDVSFYVRLKLDQLHVFIEQHDIFSVEIADDVQLFSPEDAAEVDTQGAVGAIALGEYAFRVYALSGNMARLDYLPEQARYCVIFQTEKIAYALVCEEMENLHKDYQPILQKLPVCMRTAYTPFVNLMVYQEELGCITSGEALYQYLTGGGVERDAPLRARLALG